MISDLRQAFRTLLKSPGFSALVVAVLAVGIAANTAIFTIVDAVLLKPLPFADARRLVAIDTTVRNEPDNTSGLCRLARAGNHAGSPCCVHHRRRDVDRNGRRELGGLGHRHR